MLITDSTGAPLGYLTFDLVAGEESGVFNVIVTAGARRRLESTSAASVQVLAREAAGAGAWIDLADGIALDSYAEDEQVEFEIKVVADAGFVGQERFRIWLGVTSDSAAGWGE